MANNPEGFREPVSKAKFIHEKNYPPLFCTCNFIGAKPQPNHPYIPHTHRWLRLSTTGVRRSASSGATTAAQRRAVTTSALLRPALQQAWSTTSNAWLRR